MKKISLLFITICCLFGCTKTKETETLKASQSYTIQDKLEFEIIKTELVQQIVPSNKNKTYKYIGLKDEKNIFIDIIVKTINLSSNEMKLEDIYSGQFEVNKQTYDMNNAIETVNYNQISQTDTLKLNESRYINLYCEVPQDQIKDDATINLTISNNHNYNYTFSTKQHIEKNNNKSLGDVITLKQSQVTLNQVSQSQKIEPSSKGFFYSYYPTENEDETFVILKIDFKNTSDNKLDPGEYLYCEYHVGEEKIQSQIVIESENHKSLAKSGTIESNQSRTLYLAMSVKNDLLKQSGEIHLFIEGNTFQINNDYKA